MPFGGLLRSESAAAAAKPDAAPAKASAETGGTGIAYDRLMLVLLLFVGALMVIGARWLGDDGPGLTPQPSGPGSGPAGTGGGGARAFAGTSWFGTAPYRPWSVGEPAAGTDSGRHASLSIEPVQETEPEIDVSDAIDRAAPAKGGWFQASAHPAETVAAATFGIGVAIDAATVTPVAELADVEVEAPAFEPVAVQANALPSEVVAAGHEVVVVPAGTDLVPAVRDTAKEPGAVIAATVIVVGATGALDAVALDAAADMRPATQLGRKGSKSHERPSHRFSGR